MYFHPEPIESIIIMRRRQLRSRRRRSNANAKIIVNEKNVKSEKTQKPKKIKGKLVQQQQQHMLFSSPDMETEDHDYIDNGDIDEFHRSQPYDDLGFSKNSDGFSMASTMGPLHLQGPLEKIKEYGSFEREDDDEQLPGGEDTSGSASTNQKDVDWDYSVQYLGDHYHDTNNDNDDDSHRRARGVQDDSRKSPVSHDELRSPFGRVQKLNRSWSFPLTSPNVLELPPPPPPPPSLSKYELTPPRTRRKPLGDLMNSDANTHTNSNTKEEISTPTSTARKAQKWEEVINKAWDKNGLTSPLRNKQKSQRSEPSIQEQGQDGTEGGARDRDRAGTVKKDSPGYMQFDADASQYVRKIPVEKTNNFASPSSVSTSTSAWVDQLSPTLSSPQSMTSKSMAAPTPSSSQSTNTNNQDPSNASRESLPSDIKPNLYITDSRVEISMGEMLDESRSRSQSNDNVNGMHTPARANTNDTLRSLISAAKSSFNSTRTQGAELCLDDLFSPSFINAVDLQSHCQNRTGIRLTPTVKSALDSISEIEGVSDGFAKMKSLLGTKSSSNRTEETELCVEDVFSQSFIHAMDIHPHGDGGNRIRVRSTPPTAVKSILDGISEDESVSDTSRLEQRHAAHDATNMRSSSATTCTSIFNNSSDMERWFSDKFSPRSAEDSTRSAMHHIESMIAASATKSSLNSTPEVERCIADLFDQSLANDSVMLRKGTMRSASASKFSLDSTLEVEHCVADVFDQSLANDSVMFRETSMRPASASKSSLNSTSEVEHCVADVFDQSLSNESLMGKQTTTRTRPASANIISLNSTIEVEQCVADVMEQTLAPDSAMKRHANSTSDSAAFSTTNSTIEVAECVADIMEQTLAPDSVMEHYRNSLFCGEMHSFPNGIMESSRSTMDHRERIDLLSKQASLSVADGDYEEALVALRKVLNIHLADHGEKHPLVASSHHNIGIVYSKRANDAPNNTDADESNGFALKSFHTAAQIARKMVGKSHPNVAVSLARIGLIYLQMRKYGDADITFEECLRIRKKVFGKKHPLVAKVYNNLGVAKLHMDNDEGALKAFESAGAIQKRCLKKVKHTNVDKSYKLQLELADTLCNVGTICLDLIERRKDRNDEAALLNPQLGEQAIDAFDEVLSIRTKCLGSDHALVGETKKLQKDANKLYQMSITQSERERSTVDDEESCLISKSDNSMSIPQSEGHISTCSGAGDDEESCLISNAGNEVGPGMPSAWKENSSQHGFSFLGSRTSARADSGDNDKITEMNNLAEQSLKVSYIQCFFRFHAIFQM